MQALVYQGPGKFALEDKPKPILLAAPTDAIVRITKTTICGTDLHILKGDLPAVTAGASSNEGVGVVDQVGASVAGFKVGDHVLISCVTSCGRCLNCKGHVLALPERGWLDPGQPDRRDSGGVCAHPFRGQQPVRRSRPAPTKRPS